MSSKKIFKSWLYKKYPASKEKVESYFANKPFLRQMLRIGFTPSFRGWGMSTFTHTPWGNATDLGDTEQAFNEVSSKLLGLVQDDSFMLTQFKLSDRTRMLESLLWRHYMVFWSASFAAKNAPNGANNFVECGVCDGLTAFFALSAAAQSDNEWGAYLYDAWEVMRGDLLLESEKVNQGEYSYLDVNVTRVNLASFGNHVRFNKGYIPESFAVSENPEAIIWMHIDLNSATPTIAALNYFWPRMVSRGVILFDDYAWPGYEDTRNLILAWLKDKDGMLLPLPTGQALIFKR
jgi:O-methyltransferase